MKRIDNRGVTLVELIIVMALAGIVSLMAYSFLESASRIYNVTSAEVDLQMEAQTTYNQIRDLVMTAEKGAVAFGMKKAEPDSDIDLDIDLIVEEDPVRSLNVEGKDYKALVIYNNNNIQAIIYDPEVKKLYLVQDVRTAEKYGNQAQIMNLIANIKDENLMSEGVTKFKANTSTLNSVSSDGVVKLEISFEKRGKTNTFKSYVTLRNDNVIDPDKSYN